MFKAKILPPPSLGPPIKIEKTHRRRVSLFEHGKTKIEPVPKPSGLAICMQINPYYPALAEEAIRDR